MRIIANKRVSKLELDEWKGDIGIYEETLIHKELLAKIMEHLTAYSDLFKKEEHQYEFGGATEYQVELMVFTPSSIRETLHDLQERYQIPPSAMQDLWSKLIKDL